MDHSQSAVKAALEGRWKDAIAANLALLKENPKDTETLNRLARAYLETGLKTKSLEIYQKVLKIDKFNTIAQKNIFLLKNTKIVRSSVRPGNTYQPPVFLEEPGVTKNVSLVRLGDPQVLAKFHPADEVKIVSRQHTVCVVGMSNEYIGRLPDDLASRMRDFLAGGNTYSSWIRSIDFPIDKKQPISVKVFIREEKRAPQFKFIPSFPLTEKLSYAAFTPPELIHEEKPDVSATEEQEDSTSYSRDEPSDVREFSD
jgi:hypothetical protein